MSQVQNRLIEESLKIEDILECSLWFDKQDIETIANQGIEKVPDIFKIDPVNIFTPEVGPEGIPDPFEVTLVKLFRRPEFVYLAAKYILNINLFPFQVVILKELEKHKYPMLIASRGASKSFMLAIYTILTLLFKQGSKVVVAGAGFRQARIIFNYIDAIWRKAPVLRDICGNSRHSGVKSHVDEVTFEIGDSVAKGIPIGDGGKIRGLRATHLINDEFSATNEQIYEQVISNFAAVSADPYDKASNSARLTILKSVELIEDDEEEELVGNQSILAGTADYAYLHFAKYWKKYRNIITCNDDTTRLNEIFPDGIPKKFNRSNYAVIRLPFDLLPRDFMDEEHVARSKATVNTAMYDMEFGAVFPADSTGFFRRTAIDGATCGTGNKLSYPSCGSVMFDARLRGNKNLQYVMAVDPASESDNFAIVILECWPEHRRVVYSWTTTKEIYYNMVKNGHVDNPEYNFYNFCARKIRTLHKVFNVIHIAIDSQGGGFAIEEALHSVSNLETGEQPWWQIIEEDKPKESDKYAGLHILEMVNFADAKYTYDANNFLKKDMLDKSLIFPRFSPVAAAQAAEIDKIAERNATDGVETLEGVMYEIEELKNELVSIEHTITPSGRDRWDTPQIRLHSGKKGRLRKDRYSALVMCNMSARRLQQPPILPENNFDDGLAVADIRNVKQEKSGGSLYSGNQFFDDDFGGMCLSR